MINAAIDYHYYENLKDIFSPQYDWENFILTAGINEDELDLTIKVCDRSNSQLKALQYFIHEYIHFLQNFCTTWGAGIFSDLFIAYSKISVSKLIGNECFRPPLNNKTINNLLFDDGVKSRYEILNRLTKNDSYKTELKNELKGISFYKDHEKVVLTNNICDCSIGIKAIREHMANIGTFLTLGYYDENIHEENLTCGQFVDEDGRLFQYPEYWIIFEYFQNKYPNLKNIGKGLFSLCNECLTRLNPEKAFYRFFDFFESDSRRYLRDIDFIDFVKSWTLKSFEKTSFRNSNKLIIDNLIHRLSYMNKNLNHDLPRAAQVLTMMLKKNLERTIGGREIFSELNDFSNLQSWYKIINRFGSSIVSFNQEIKLLGSMEYCQSNLMPFIVLNSVTLAFKEINNNSCSFSCPFLVDIPICKAEYKDESICDNSPFDMIKKQNVNKCCNLIAGVFLLGLDQRILCDN